MPKVDLHSRIAELESQIDHMSQELDELDERIEFLRWSRWLARKELTEACEELANSPDNPPQDTP